MPASSFEDKLLSKLDKLHLEQIQDYLAQALAQKQFQQTVFDHLDQGVLVTDAALRLIFLNRKARAMLSLPGRRNLLGEYLPDLVMIEPLQGVIASLMGRPRPIEGYECPAGARAERILSLTTVPMNGPGQLDIEHAGDAEEQPLLMILLSDATERHKRLEEQARAQRLASLTTLTSGIAHEIKNPLNSLNIHAQLLEQEIRRARDAGENPDLGKTERVAHVVRDETERLRVTVEEFLAAARPMRPNLERRPISELIEAAERLFRLECAERGVNLDIVIDPDLPPVLYDTHQMMQALRNLVRNAIEALTTENWRAWAAQDPDYEPAIGIEAHARTESVHLVVMDNGPGIPEEMLMKVFEPYYTTKFGGSGLGLMVVYRIVTEHRGLLHVDTKAGEGSRFEIALPIDERPIKLLAEKHGLTLQPKTDDDMTEGNQAETNA